MIKIIISVVLSVFALPQLCLSQDNSVNSINAAMEKHLDKLKSQVNDYRHVFVSLKIDDSLSLPEKMIYVDCVLSGATVKKHDKNYLVVAHVLHTEKGIELHIVDFDVIRKSKSKFQLISFFNETYHIPYPNKH